MAESVTKDSTDHSGKDEPEAESNEQATGVSVAKAAGEMLQLNSLPAATGVPEQGRIIWTPKFIVWFALVLTLGLSADSLFTRGWAEGFFRAIWVLFGNFAILLGLWIGAVVTARSWWVRLGAIFGCAWALFSILNLVTMLLNFDLNTDVPAYLNAAYSCALLGAYICLSTAYCEIYQWDMWFFRIAVVAGGVFVLIGILFPSAANSIPGALATDIATFATFMNILTWLARPRCWRTHPSLTFFFTVSPLIALLLSLPNITNAGGNFFFEQVSLLCLVLGLMRLIQGERVQ